MFCTFRAFQKAWFWMENLITRRFLILKKNKASDFQLKFLKSVRFKINFQNTRQTSNWIFYNVSDFECTSFAVCQVIMRSSKQSTFR